MILKKRKQDISLEDWSGFSEMAEDVSEYAALVELFAEFPNIYWLVLKMKMHTLDQQLHVHGILRRRGAPLHERKERDLYNWCHTGNCDYINWRSHHAKLSGDFEAGYALDAIRWTVEHGILSGFGDGLLSPKGLATRAQVAVSNSARLS